MSTHRLSPTISVCAILGIIGMLGSPAAAATTVTLTDANSSVFINLDSGVGTGVKDWNVDGTDPLYQQWFWYRLGPTGAASPIDTLTLSYFNPSDINGDGNTDALFARYLGNGLKVEVTFVLAGGSPGSRTSDLAEIVKVTNIGETTADLHLFQYADFDLNNPFDTVRIEGANTAIQTGGNWRVVGADAPLASHFQAATYPTILNELNSPSFTSLTDATGPVNGDCTWAFQWDKTLAPRGSFIISKDINITPEPATLTLVGIGLAASLLRRRKR